MRDSEKLLKQNKVFDVVISRHFIEHVISPRQWVSNLKKVLNPGGFLIIETPNAFFSLKRGLVEGFSLQHLQGFSSYSLNYTLDHEGLAATTIEETPHNLIVLAVQGKSQNQEMIASWDSTVQQFDQKLGGNLKKIEGIISEYVQKKGKIGMWGAGGFGQAALTLYNIPKDSINFIVDSDPQKWELQYLDNSIPIISPEQAKSFDPDLFIITSMYSESIMKNILEMDFKTSILNIFPEVSYEANVR